MIEQVRVSHGLRRFKPGIMSRWGLKDYHDINAPCLFFNINNQEDIDAVKNHKGFKLIFFANARGNQFINHFKGISNMVVIANPYLDIPEGMKVKDGIFEIKDYSMFKPNKLGDKIYCYVGNNSQKNRYGYDRALKIQKRIGYEIIFGMQGHTMEYVKKNYYDNCFLNLNLNITGGGGHTTVRELARMGRRTIINTKFDYLCGLSYKDDDDIIRLINEESKKIGTIQAGVDYHTVGGEWLNVGFWNNITLNIEDLLSLKNTYMDNEGYGGGSIKHFPFYMACKTYLTGKKELGRENYYNVIKNLFEKHQNKYMGDGGIKGFWWYNKIVKHPTLEQGIQWWVDDRFALLESVKRDYSPYREEIIVRRKDGEYYLCDGYHRVAALCALGYKKIENIRVK